MKTAESPEKSWWIIGGELQNMVGPNLQKKELQKAMELCARNAHRSNSIYLGII
jgi:hypothetical protein